MAAEVVRDVLLKLRLEQQPVDIKAPDLSAVFRQYEQFGDMIEASAKKVASANREIERSAKATTKAKEDSAKAEASAAKASESAAETTAKAAQKANQEAAKAADRHSEAQLKVGDALGKTIEGSLNAAKGLALLGLTGEDESKKIVQGIALIEGGYQSLKGGFEVVKGISETTRAMRAVTLAAAAAETTRAAATTATGTAATAATGAVTALNASMGPVGVAATALVATVGALGVAYMAMSSDAASANDAMEDSLNDQVETLKLINVERDRELSLIKEMAKIEAKDVATKLALTDDPVERLRIIEEASRKVNVGAPKFGLDQSEVSSEEEISLATSRAEREKQAAKLARLEHGSASAFVVPGVDSSSHQAAAAEARQTKIAEARKALLLAQKAELEAQAEIQKGAISRDQEELEAVRQKVDLENRRRDTIKEIAETRKRELEEIKQEIEKAKDIAGKAQVDATYDPGDKQKQFVAQEADRKLREVQARAGDKQDTVDEINAEIDALMADRDAKLQKVVAQLDQLRETERAGDTANALLQNKLDKIEDQIASVVKRLGGDR